MKRVRTLAAAIFLAALAAQPARLSAMASEDYRLQAGDVVEFGAAGEPNLTSRSTVGTDGTVTLPLVGRLDARDLSVDELRRKVQQSIVSKVYRRRGPEGQDSPATVAPDEVTLRISEYRPVYVNGDVSKPGEVKYRPGLTVRQSVALSGGYDVMRFRMSNPFLEQADLRSEYERTWLDLARAKSMQKRLLAELSGNPSIDGAFAANFPIGSKTTARMIGVESDLLAARNAVRRKERDSLQKAIDNANRRIAVLAEQEAKEKAGQSADQEELERVEALLKRGSTPITRVIDARRTILFASTRLLQTVALRFQAERERDELSSKLAKMDDEMRAGLFTEMGDAQGKENAALSQLRAIGDKLAYVGMVRSQLVAGADAKPNIMIIRNDGKTARTIEADEETELLPGDVVEIMLRKGFVPVSEGAE